MATLSDIRNVPLSGNIHIDALLNRGGLNWTAVTDIPYNTIRYSFSLAGDILPAAENIVSGTATGFTALQQSATRGALAYLSEITGIQFLETGPAEADVHFANASITTERVVGSFNWRSQYWEDGAGTITRYELDGVVYLDNAEYADYNSTLASGSEGYETLLHELGHMLGLKHPFEDAIQLPTSLDSTSNTLMSYDSSGRFYSEYRPFDLAALGWLYGGDGIGGNFGIDAQGRMLVGTTSGDQLVGTTGMDLLAGLNGNDTIDGGAGLDYAAYLENRAGYRISRTDQGFSVTGTEGTDVLRNIERMTFDNVDVALDIDGNGGAAYRLYQAAFNRVPDAVGLGYWISVLDDGVSLRDVAASFLASPEFAAIYQGSNPDNGTLVAGLYQNILHRPPEQAGYEYWLDVLNKGGDRATVLRDFSEGFENRDALASVIGNGFDYIPYA
ncbi:DUF4214 domain-containing protein [Pseudoduganella lutea]|uniref:DUF4214 domain-containing protein n=1 Tax=Pseudoduganella lutea TaxID=321985 RepID=UPI0013EEB1F4|nr:DUF4214 domain-containing protein [Pseudoduganella lutea]